MDATQLRDPTRCPDCGVVLTDRPAACPSCALPLQGQLVEQLWWASQAAADALDARAALLRALREPTTAAPPPAPAPAGPTTPWPTPTWSPPERRKPRETVTPRTIQQTLLALGVLLLAVAALIFTVVAWGRLGIGGRTAILAALTAAAAVGTRFAHRRELPGTAEALGTLTLALLLLDAYGIRENDLAGTGDTAADAYWAAVLGTLAVLAFLAHRVLPLRVLRIAAAVGVQLPLFVLADRFGDVAATVVLLAQGTVVLGALRPVRPASARLVLLVGGGLTWVGSAINATVLAYGEDADTSIGTAAGAGLLGLVAAGAATLARHHRGTVAAPEIGSAVAATALLGAAHAPMHRAWEHDAATAGGVALLLAVALTLTAVPLPRQWRDGPLVVLGVAGLAALLDVAEPVTRAVTGPFEWLDDPWSQPLDSNAREVLGTTWPHHGTVAVTLALLTAAAVLIGFRFRAQLAGQAAGLAAGVLATATAVVLPVATEAPYLVAVLGLVGTGCALLVWAALSRHHVVVAIGLTAAGSVAAGIGLVWSLAARSATPLALAGVLAAAAVVRAFGGRHLAGLVATGVATAAAVAEVGVLTRIADVSAAAAGTAAVTAAGVLAVAAGLVGRELERRTLELSALGAAVVAFGAVKSDGHWSSLALLAGGVAAALVALRRDRRPAGWLAGALLTLSSWVRLAMADVQTPEAYTTGPAVALVIAGAFAARRDAELSSWRAYGAGLTVGFAPSLVATPGDDGLLRPLLLGGVSLVVLLAGVRFRLQAPLVLGAVVLAVDALIQIGPYAAALPRWVSIGGAGLLLLVLGVSFERRLRELRRVAARLAELG
ncbi:SCO7613 C-terminal domain-containing membrane protein [Sporichthya polymorpha]|uniref:SCO7613 C-terminal domain-containing membrane protein n=1 Tax=Sporichthya polymorpha TaxID=35751 RepID=UPI000367193E|nr:hypothetical protein [Sporichthya polymorpha]